jgi:ribonuclease VapC
VTIIDTSALVAVLFDEPDKLRFEQALLSTSSLRMSAVTAVELSVVAQHRAGPEADAWAESLLQQFDIELVAFDREQAQIARHAFMLYGKGRHPAGLNFGDLFAYALSKATGEPLLFKGDDFRKTDVEPAL